MSLRFDSRACIKCTTADPTSHFGSVCASVCLLIFSRVPPRHVAARGANRRGPQSEPPRPGGFRPTFSLLFKLEPSPLLPLLAFPILRAQCSSLSAPPPFFVRRRPLELCCPANSRRISTGPRRAEIFCSTSVATTAFSLLRAPHRFAVDGARRRPQARCFAAEPLPQRPLRLRLVPISLCLPLACFLDLGSTVFLFPLFL
jgi:hypothetical protein